MNDGDFGNNGFLQSPIWIIWFALLVSVGLYALIGLVIRQAAADSFSASTLDGIAWASIIAAVIQTVLTHAVSPLIARHGGNFQTWCILRWALNESIGLFGLVLAMLGGSLAIATLLWLFCGLHMIYLAPGQRTREKFEALKSGE